MRSIFAILLVVATATASTLVRVEERSNEPAAWKRSSIPPSPRYVLPLRIGLKQSNLHRLEEELLRVSDPESPAYGEHWTTEQVTEFFQPSLESVKSVREWLKKEAIYEKTELSASRAWVLVNVTVAQAESLLGTKYHVYEHENGNRRIACPHYSVPSHLQEHIELITPTLHFDVPEGIPQPVLPSHEHQKRKDPVVAPGTGRQVGKTNGNHPKLAPAGFTGALLKVLGELANCATVTTPVCLQALYDMELYTPVAKSKNSFGIVEYTPQTYVASDLDLFFTNYSKSQIGQRPIFAAIDNGVLDFDPANAGFDGNGEANLDLQYGMALTKGQPVTLYQTGDIAQGASFNNLLDGIDASYCTYQGGDDPTQDGIYPSSVNCGVAARANVISTSYGYNEVDLTPAYEQRQCNEYGKLGLLGTTFVFSSGDYGVAGNTGQCIDPATGQFTDSGTQFVPAFPATCPYVTTIGATETKTGGLLAGEKACETVIYSGGGFSNNFAMPSYQASAVASYFAKYKPAYTASQYNNSMKTRGYPDISANGANYYVYVQGKGGLVYGTSASAPVVGSIFSNINDARLAIGKKPIGFVNPTLYSAAFAGALKDITSGGNQGCGTPGFTAVPGWDPVTGLGTPSQAGLMARWLLLP